MSSLTISIFQPMAREEVPEARLSWLDLAAERAASQGSKLLICPELSLTGYRISGALRDRAKPLKGEYFEQVSEIASLHEVAIIYGHPEEHGGSLYNTSVLIDADGEMVGSHRKIHIPPGFERLYFNAGDQINVFQLHGWKVAILICYDIEFPEAARQASLAGADLLIVPTALAENWNFVAEKMVPTRAWENGVFLAYVNWTGVEEGVPYLGGSRVIGPDGVEDLLAGNTEELRTVTLEKSRIEAARSLLKYLQDRREFSS